MYSYFSNWLVWTQAGLTQEALCAAHADSREQHRTQQNSGDVHSVKGSQRTRVERPERFRPTDESIDTAAAAFR